MAKSPDCCRARTESTLSAVKSWAIMTILLRVIPAALLLAVSATGCQRLSSPKADVISELNTPGRYILVSRGTPRAVWRIPGKSVDGREERFTEINGRL